MKGKSEGQVSRLRWPGVVGAVLVLLPMLYFLSIGPVGAIAVRTGHALNSPPLRAFYAPMGWLANQSGVFAVPIYYYVCLWVPCSEGNRIH